MCQNRTQEAWTYASNKSPIWTVHQKGSPTICWKQGEIAQRLMDTWNKGHLQPKKRPKLLPLLYLNRERFNSFWGQLVLLDDWWQVTTLLSSAGATTELRCTHDVCKLTAVPTLLDKVCEESRTCIEVVCLLLEMTTFLEEPPPRKCDDKCPLSGSIIPLMPPCINNPMSKPVFTKKIQQPKLLIGTLRLWTSRIRCSAQLWA